MADNGKAKILVVDDVEVNRLILQEILACDYLVEQAEDGTSAISQMLNSIVKPDLVLLDIMMPELDGFEVLKLMKSNPSLQKIPVIFITAADAEREGLGAGAVDYISKPFEPAIVSLRVANHIELNLYRQRLEGLIEQKALELIATKEKFLEAMANLIEYRSLESGHHVKRTRELFKILVRQLVGTGRYAQQLAKVNYDTMIKAVPLHDIGKVAISDNILLKPGKLTAEEFKIIETHTTIGAQAIESLMSDAEDEYLRHCYDICRFHHERWDGTGYPDGIAGEKIPLSARIVAVIDVYDALVSERCYKKAFSHEESLAIIKESAGNHFDPQIVDALLEVQEDFRRYEN